MKELDALRGIDVYLIDQMMKGMIRSDSKILDAGCGFGRNIHYLISQGLDVKGIDPNQKVIDELKNQHPEVAQNFICSTLEEFKSEVKFDFIICNAVLHFAENHVQFDKMFSSLIAVLASGGILFIRMTSTIGMNLDFSETGVYFLPDGSTRYLITREQITKLCDYYSLRLIEPVKTVKVEELRSMSTLVFSKF